MSKKSPFEIALGLARKKVQDGHQGQLKLISRCAELEPQIDYDDAYHRGLDHALARGDFRAAGLYLSKIQTSKD